MHQSLCLAYTTSRDACRILNAYRSFSVKIHPHSRSSLEEEHLVESADWNTEWNQIPLHSNSWIAKTTLGGEANVPERTIYISNTAWAQRVSRKLACDDVGGRGSWKMTLQSELFVVKVWYTICLSMRYYLFVYEISSICLWDTVCEIPYVYGILSVYEIDTVCEILCLPCAGFSDELQENEWWLNLQVSIRK